MQENDNQTIKPKRYMAFCGSYFYPCGGWSDFAGTFDTIEDAKYALRGKHDWRQIVDTETMEEV